MCNKVTITVSGPQGCGKSLIATALEHLLKDEEIAVQMGADEYSSPSRAGAMTVLRRFTQELRTLVIIETKQEG